MNGYHVCSSEFALVLSLFIHSTNIHWAPTLNKFPDLELIFCKKASLYTSQDSTRFFFLVGSSFRQEVVLLCSSLIWKWKLSNVYKIDKLQAFLFYLQWTMQRKYYFKISLGAEQAQVTKIKEAQPIFDLGNLVLRGVI